MGAIVPGFSSLAEPSAREIAALEDAIRAANVPAVFVDETMSHALARQVAGDTGARLVTLQISAPDGEIGAEGYFNYLKKLVDSIVAALGGTS